MISVRKSKKLCFFSEGNVNLEFGVQEQFISKEEN